MGEVIDHAENCCAACAAKIDATYQAIEKISRAISSIDLSTLSPMDLIKGLMAKR